MSIKTYLDELEAINIEIKKYNQQLYKYRKRRRELETYIKGYLQSTDSPGLKYKKHAIVLQDVKRQASKPKDEKMADMIDYLHSLGIHNPEDVYKDIIKIQKNPVVKKELKIKNIR